MKKKRRINLERVSVKIALKPSKPMSDAEQRFDDLLFYGACAWDENGKRIHPMDIIITK